MPPISDELKAIYASPPTDDYYIETLELAHSQLELGSIYITNQLSGWTAQLESGTQVFYEFLPFMAIPPSAAEEGNLTLQVAIDNASRAIMEQLEALATEPRESIKVTYRVYLASDSATVQNDPPLRLNILNVTVTTTAISFAAGLDNLRNIQFPAQLYTTELYPGLAR